MELEKYKIKFDTYKKYQNKMPGIKSGLSLLRKLNEEKDSIDTLSILSVQFYDFVDDKVCNYSLDQIK